MTYLRILALLLFGALALSYIASGRAAAQSGPRFAMVCNTYAKALATELSKLTGEPVGGPFAFRDEVCVMWRNAGK